MQGDDLESLKLRIVDLENKNKNLHEQLDKLQEEDEEIISYRLFVKARDHFLKWLNLVTLGLATIGLLTIAEI